MKGGIARFQQRSETDYSDAKTGVKSEESVPLIAHVIYRLDVGGLENGLVNLINHLPVGVFRHVIICLSDYNDQFCRRIARDDVAVYSLGKREGKDPGAYLRLWCLLRKLKPAVVHTRNIGTLDCVPIAAAAGIRIRLHGEHGWDVFDLYGTRRSYRWLRRAITPLTYRYIALSRHLSQWLESSVGVPTNKVVHIYNGVDTERFQPGALASRQAAQPFVIGSVGRLETVKDPLNLVDAVLVLLHRRPELKRRMRLAMLGDGTLMGAVHQRFAQASALDCVELCGAVDDVAARMRGMDLFVLSSRNEGISNTILEAMASGLPVVATRVGGNSELVVEGETGMLVPPSDPQALAMAIEYYLDAPEQARLHGAAGRRRAETCFSLGAMVTGYQQVYLAALRTAAGSKR